MDKRIRAMLGVLVGLFALLFLQLNNLQVRMAPSLDASKYEPASPGVKNPYAEPRGDIVTAGGKVLAASRPAKKGDPYGPQRYYPYGSLFEDVTGYFDAVDSSATGLEAEYNNYLIKHQPTASTLKGLLTEQSGTDSVATTVSYGLQKVAAEALAPYARGAIVAIDPQNGDILAMYGKPSFNPGLLASHNPKVVARNYKSLNPQSGTSPLVNFATQYTAAPGSTMKVVTTSAIFDHKPQIASQVFPNLGQLALPGTPLPLHNYANEVCGGTLANALAVSCDTTYAQIGLELGAKNLASEAAAFGFNRPPPIDLPPSEVATPCFPPVEGQSYNVPSCPSSSAAAIGPGNQPFIAYSAIGQGNVTESALQDALVTAAIANNGAMMTPHLMSAIVNDAGRIVDTYKPHVYLNSTSAKTAQSVRSLMLGVASYGTAAGLFPANLHVAAKTGTAQVGGSGVCTTNWLVAMGPAGAGQTPRIAVAGVVPAQAGLACQETGAGIAGPAVAKVLDAYLTGNY